MPRLDMHLESQMELLRELQRDFLDEYHAFPEEPSEDGSVYARNGRHTVHIPSALVAD